MANSQEKASQSSKLLWGENGWNSCLILLPQDESPKRSLSPTLDRIDFTKTGKSQSIKKEELDVFTIFNRASKSHEQDKPILIEK